MAVIELDLNARPDATPTPPPPAHRYRLPGLMLAAVLVLAAGGAAPIMPVLWRYLGAVPAPGGPEMQFQLTGGLVYTVATDGAERAVTAWTPAAPPRRLWTTRLPPLARADDFNGVSTQPAGDVVLLVSAGTTTAVDTARGSVRWRLPVPVTALAGGRYGFVEDPRFRDGTAYDEASGNPGILYFSATGEPHTEPPLHTEMRGIDLTTGATAWTITAAGAVNLFDAGGDRPAVLLLTSKALQLVDGARGEIRQRVALPAVDGSGPTSGDVVGDLMLVHYGAYGSISREVAYSPETLARRWSRSVPPESPDPPRCTDMLCAAGRGGMHVLDPVTGRPQWRVPDGMDLIRRGDVVLQAGHESGVPERLLDPVTGAARVDLTGWRTWVNVVADHPLVLERDRADGTGVFGVVVARHDMVQPLGVTDGPVSDCVADQRYVVCRTDGGLRVWSYRA